MARSPYRTSERSPHRTSRKRSPIPSPRRGRDEPARGRAARHRSADGTSSRAQYDSNQHRNRNDDFVTPRFKRKTNGEDYVIPKKPRKLNFDDSRGKSDDEGKTLKEVTEKQKKEMRKQSEEITDLKHQIEVKADSLKAKDGKLKRLEKEDAEQKDLMNKIKEENTKLKKKSELKDKTIQKTVDLELKNKKLARELKVAKDEIDDLKSELTTKSRDARCDATKKMSEDIKKIRKERNEASKDRERYRKERDEAKEELEKSINSLKDTKEDLEKLEETKEKMRIERDWFKHQQSAMEELEKSLEEMKIQRDESERLLRNKANEWNKKEKEMAEGFAKIGLTDQKKSKSKHSISSDDEKEEEPSDNDDREEEPSDNDDREEEPSDNDENSTYIVEDIHYEDKSQTTNSNNLLIEGDEVVSQKDMFETASLEVVLHSDEEFPDDTKDVKNYEVKYYKKPSSCLSIGIKPPSKYLSKHFKPVVTSLNNRIMFISCGDMKTNHTPDPRYKGTACCGLSPACSIKWVEGDQISRVFILGSNTHPNDLTEVWCCTHHNKASVEGFLLQTQYIAMRHKAGYRQNAATEVGGKIDEKEDYNDGEEVDDNKDKDDLSGVKPLKQVHRLSRTKGKKAGSKSTSNEK
jgi:hypothetical protein